MVEADVYLGWNALDSLALDWDRVWRSCGNGVLGPDATCSFVWTKTLSRTLLCDADVEIHVLSESSEVVGLLPVYRRTARNAALHKVELRLITEAYAGRSGFLVKENDAALTASLLEQLKLRPNSWDVFLFSTVDGSPSQAIAIDAAKKLGFKAVRISESRSPYIVLADGFESAFGSLPKKMRWTIRKSERDLRARGNVEYQELKSQQETDELIRCIYDIERRSWKERTGTSITTQQQQQRFYEAFVELAADAGALSGHLLRLNGRPIAYVLGVAAGDGVFLDLKESFDLSHSEFSPGHVLKRFVLETLASRGVQTYDFMGSCETYKMKWTDRTYNRVTYAFYNSTPRAALHRFGARVMSRMRALEPALGNVLLTAV